MARALRRHHDHVHAFRRNDRLEVHVKPVRETQHLARRQVRLDRLLVNLRLHFIRQGDDDEVGLLHRVFNAEQLKAAFDRELAVGGFFAVGDDDFNAAVAKVLPVGVPLAAKAENGDGFCL